MIGIDSVERDLSFRSYVYVPIDTDNSTIKSTIVRQIKSAIGSLNLEKISLNSSDFAKKIKDNEITREVLTVLNPNGSSHELKKIQKITYYYYDTAVVSSKLEGTKDLETVLLANDYNQYAEELIRICTDGISADLETLWYYYRPQMSSCKERINYEIKAIEESQKGFEKDKNNVSQNEIERWFIPVKINLGVEKKVNRKIYPEYDRLFGLDGFKEKLIIYVINGVDLDSSLPDDRFGLEYLSFLRKMLKDSPNFQLTGKPLENNIDDLFKWLLEHNDYPSEMANDPAKVFKFLSQAMSQLAERWLYWEQVVKISSLNAKGEKTSKEMLIQVRSFYGNDETSPEIKQAAKARYLEAFREGDVLIYNGHAQFGKGVMDPLQYRSEDFDEHYQLMVFNSCYSFSYYHQDYFNLKPGGKKNLDMVVNGLASKIKNSGEVNAAFLNGLMSLEDYENILIEMRKISGFDALQVVDGETDNVYLPLLRPIEIVHLK